MKRIHYMAGWLGAGLFLMLVFSLVAGQPGLAEAAWKPKIVRNQIKVAEYITTLQEGGNPDTLERPVLRRDNHSRANAANREMREMMDEAESLARSGKNELIKDPEFKVELVSEETYRLWEKEYHEK